MLRGTTAPTPCQTLDFGEVEDYTVNIAANLQGDGTEGRQAAAQLDAVSGVEEVNLYGALDFSSEATDWKLEKSTDGHSFQLLQSGQSRHSFGLERSARASASEIVFIRFQVGTCITIARFYTF